jgi:hypothetical protein
MKVTDKLHFNKFAFDYTNDIEKEIRNFTDFESFALSDAKFDWSERRTRSRGGRYPWGLGISIAMYHATKHDPQGVHKVYEYRSYTTDPIIGSIYIRDPLHGLRMIILHELAHTMQYYHYRKFTYRCKPHGKMFKQWYKMLRVNFLNNDLPNQQICKAKYEKDIQKLVA